MKIPQVELEKMKQLQEKLNQLAEVEHKTHYWDQFAPTCADIIQGCSSKLTKCDAKIMLEKELSDHYDYNTHFALTREGLKERFGNRWSSSEPRLAKARKFSGTGWVSALLKDGEEKVDIIPLLQAVRKNKEVTVPEGIDRLVECISDLRNTSLRCNNKYDETSKTNVTVLKEVNLTLQPDPDSNGDFVETPFKYIHIALCKKDTSRYYYGGQHLVEFSRSLQSIKDGNDFKFSFGEDIKFNDYCRVSEPEVFESTLKAIDEFIVKLEKQIEEDTASIRAFIDKWGVYAIKQEL